MAGTHQLSSVSDIRPSDGSSDLNPVYGKSQRQESARLTYPHAQTIPILSNCRQASHGLLYSDPRCLPIRAPYTRGGEVDRQVGHVNYSRGPLGGGGTQGGFYSRAGMYVGILATGRRRTRALTCQPVHIPRFGPRGPVNHHTGPACRPHKVSGRRYQAALPSIRPVKKAVVRLHDSCILRGQGEAGGSVIRGAYWRQSHLRALYSM